MSVPVWGWAEPDSEITLKFAGQKKTATADADAYDAKPWAWSFEGIGNIAKIVFTRTATTDAAGTTLDTNNAQFPLAFNNFNPVSSVGFFTPEPSSLLAFGGIFSLAVLRRRNRRVCG